MYVCLCNGFTDHDVKRSTAGGDCCSVLDVYKSLGCRPQCGKCVPMVREMVESNYLPQVAAEAMA